VLTRFRTRTSRARSDPHHHRQAESGQDNDRDHHPEFSSERIMNADDPARIAALFRRGYSLDRISEMGTCRDKGWTRADAQRVVRDNDWSLDWAGRLQARFRLPEDLPVSDITPTPVVEADLERMLAVGIDHEVFRIKQAARKAQDALDNLRDLLILQEKADAQAAAERAYVRQMKDEQAEQRRAEALDNIDHGSWSGYRIHILNGIPLCGPCEAAGAVQMMRVAEGRAASRSRVS
jgi:hypothetical protein